MISSCIYRFCMRVRNLNATNVTLILQENMASIDISNQCIKVLDIIVTSVIISRPGIVCFSSASTVWYCKKSTKQLDRKAIKMRQKQQYLVPQKIRYVISVYMVEIKLVCQKINICKQQTFTIQKRNENFLNSAFHIQESTI